MRVPGIKQQAPVGAAHQIKHAPPSGTLQGYESFTDHPQRMGTDRSREQLNMGLPVDAEPSQCALIVYFKSILPPPLLGPSHTCAVLRKPTMYSMALWGGMDVFCRRRQHPSLAPDPWILSANLWMPWVLLAASWPRGVAWHCMISTPGASGSLPSSVVSTPRITSLRASYLITILLTSSFDNTRHALSLHWKAYYVSLSIVVAVPVGAVPL